MEKRRAQRQQRKNEFTTSPRLATPSLDVSRARRLRWAVWLPLPGLLLYAAVLAWYSGACAGWSDSSGYLNNARMLSHAQLSIRMRRLPGMDPASLPSYTCMFRWVSFPTRTGQT